MLCFPESGWIPEASPQVTFGGCGSGSADASSSIRCLPAQESHPGKPVMIYNLNCDQKYWILSICSRIKQV